MMIRKYIEEYAILFSTISWLSSALLISLMIPNIYAQDFDDEFSFDEDLLITDTDAISGGASITDYIIGEFGFVNGNNESVIRSAAIYNLGLDIPFPFGRFYATYGGVESKLSITQSLRDPGFNPDNRPLERTIKTESEDVDLREAFLQINLSSFMILSTGRQRNAWGQFEIFSPAVLMLPLNANFTSLVPSKLDLLQPQDQVQLSIFPTSRIELSLYAISSLRTDPTIEVNARRWLNPTRTEGSDGNIASDANPNNSMDELSDDDFFAMLDNITMDDFLAASAVPTKKEIKFKRHADPKQSAVRLAFFPDWGTVAFTHHTGYNALNPLLKGKVLKGIGVDSTEDGIDNPPISIIASVTSNDDKTYLYYPEGTLSAFEIAVPTGKWTWRLEVAQIKSIAALDGTGGNIYLDAEDAGFTKDSVDEFLAAIGDKTRDEELHDTALFYGKRTATSAGFQYQGNIWKFDMTVLSLADFKPIGTTEERIVNAYDALQDRNVVEEEEPLEILPVIKGFRKRGDEKQHTYGFSLGAVGVSFGYGLIYSYNFTEDLSLAFSAGKIKLDSSTSNDAFYKTNIEGFTSQTSLAWRF